MAVTLYERHDSRPVRVNAQGGGVTLSFDALGSSDEVEVYVAALAGTPTTYDGFVRTGVNCTPRGGPLWSVEVEYGPFGLGGTSDPVGPSGLGGDHNNDNGSPGGDEPLGPEYHLQLALGRQHVVQSRRTLSSTRRGGGAAPDYKRAINVTEDGAQGVDLEPPQNGWSITVTRPTLTLNYIKDLKRTIGGTNISAFYGFPRDEVLYLGVDGQYGQNQQWTLTHKFSWDPYEDDYEVCDGLAVPKVGGHTYLWVRYEKAVTAGNFGVLPLAAYVEQVYPNRTFTLLDIGV